MYWDRKMYNISPTGKENKIKYVRTCHCGGAACQYYELTLKLIPITENKNYY